MAEWVRGGRARSLILVQIQVGPPLGFRSLRNLQNSWTAAPPSRGPPVLKYFRLARRPQRIALGLRRSCQVVHTTVARRRRATVLYPSRADDLALGLGNCLWRPSQAEREGAEIDIDARDPIVAITCCGCRSPSGSPWRACENANRSRRALLMRFHPSRPAACRRPPRTP